MNTDSPKNSEELGNINHRHLVIKANVFYDKNGVIIHGAISEKSNKKLDLQQFRDFNRKRCWDNPYDYLGEITSSRTVWHLSSCFSNSFLLSTFADPGINGALI